MSDLIKYLARGALIAGIISGTFYRNECFPLIVNSSPQPVYGIQAGIGNIPDANPLNKVYGVQMGVLNTPGQIGDRNKNKVNGIQIGVANDSANINGIQLALAYNFGTKFKGLQAAIGCNSAEYGSCGVQIGLLNRRVEENGNTHYSLILGFPRLRE